MRQFGAHPAGALFEISKKNQYLYGFLKQKGLLMIFSPQQDMVMLEKQL
jgi:hypothetical protein